MSVLLATSPALRWDSPTRRVKRQRGLLTSEDMHLPAHIRWAGLVVDGITRLGALTAPG